MNSDHQTETTPNLIGNEELVGFRQKTNQLMSDLENNDIDNALKCIEEINEINGKSFYSIIGKLTRGLHDAVADLSLPSHEGGAENDRTRVDLNYVIDLTDEAAKKTLDMTEQSTAKIQQLKDNSKLQDELLSKLTQSSSLDDKSSKILAELATVSTENGNYISELGHNNTEIVMAQNFQDIASQSLTKAINLIKEVEGSLITLTQYANFLNKLSKFASDGSSPINSEASEELKSNIDQMNEIGEPENLNQNDVDNLLSSLGF